MSRTLGYLRVSTDKQDVANQRHRIGEYAGRNDLSVDSWIEVEASSRKSEHDRRIDEVLASLGRGDSLLVAELSRLGRSIVNNLNLIEAIRAKGVTLHIIREGLRTNGKADTITTGILANLSFAAQLERDQISQRTKDALARKKAEGVKLGNPNAQEIANQRKAKALADAETHYGPILTELVDKGFSQNEIVQELNARQFRTLAGNDWNRATLNKALKRLGLKTKGKAGRRW